jgi:hypothetical protein
MVATEHFPKIENCEQYLGSETIERIIKKARNLSKAHVVHVNAAYFMRIVNTRNRRNC